MSRSDTGVGMAFLWQRNTQQKRQYIRGMKAYHTTSLIAYKLLSKLHNTRANNGCLTLLIVFIVLLWRILCNKTFHFLRHTYHWTFRHRPPQVRWSPNLTNVSTKCDIAGILERYWDEHKLKRVCQLFIMTKHSLHCLIFPRTGCGWWRSATSLANHTTRLSRYSRSNVHARIKVLTVTMVITVKSNAFYFDEFKHGTIFLRPIN